MDKDAVYRLAKKISDKDNLRSISTNIMRCASSTSVDSFIVEYDNKAIKRDVNRMKESIHKISEYIEELEAHIYNGEIDGER